MSLTLLRRNFQGDSNHQKMAFEPRKQEKEWGVMGYT
jgi:hypothetical protein